MSVETTHDTASRDNPLISDKERDIANEALCKAANAGTITAAELEQRLGQVAQARTFDRLNAIIADMSLFFPKPDFASIVEPAKHVARLPVKAKRQPLSLPSKAKVGKAIPVVFFCLSTCFAVGSIAYRMELNEDIKDEIAVQSSLMHSVYQAAADAGPGDAWEQAAKKAGQKYNVDVKVNADAGSIAPEQIIVNKNDQGFAVNGYAKKAAPVIVDEEQKLQILTDKASKVATVEKID